MNRGCRWLLAAGCLLLATCCSLPGCGLTSNYNLATQREEVTFTSTDKEERMGLAIAKQVEEKYPPVQDEALQERVRRIGQRLAAVSDRKELTYHFTVIPEDEVNAFSLPGGYIFVNKGLVDKADADDELAGVLAHEIGHVAARHSVKRYENSLGTALAQVLVLGTTRDPRFTQGVSIALGQLMLAYSRENEIEADRLGVRYLRSAGYRPEAMATFLEKLRELDRKRPRRALGRGVTRPYYALTHPYVSDRLRVVKQALYGHADFVDYINKTE